MFSRATEMRSSSCSRTGSSARHGRHQGAQKSTTTGSPPIVSSKVAASSSSTRGMVAALQPVGKCGEAKSRDARDSLEEDPTTHLRLALEAVDEADRDLDDAKAFAQRPVRPFDLEGVALRMDCIQ